MPTLWSPSVPATTPNIVYYPELWYSTHFRLDHNSYTGRYIENSVERHRRNFRLLSLVFPMLYIPRTHLVTHFNAATSTICRTATDCSEYKYFRDIEFIYSSHYPHLDAQSDIERIATRIGRATWLYRGHIHATWPSVLRTPSIPVDSLKEARSNVVTFSAGLPAMELFNPNAAKRLTEILHASAWNDIPFFHERFLFLLSKSDISYVEQIWRETNSIYLLSGLPDRSDVVAYYNPAYESPDYRFIRNRFDRLLYAPNTILEFFRLFLSQTQIHKLLNGWRLQIFENLRTETNGHVFDEFREAYCSMVFEISKATWILERRGLSNTIALSELFHSYLYGSLESFTKAIGAEISAITGAGLHGTLPDGITAAALKQALTSSAAPISRLAKHLVLRFRQPAIHTYVSLLQHQLDHC